jgi:hypothetical protein
MPHFQYWNSRHNISSAKRITHQLWRPWYLGVTNPRCAGQNGKELRVSTRHARSPLAHNSHVEAPSVDDGCCPANSGWRNGVSADMRASEALHSQASFSRHSARTKATKRFHESGVVLAGRYGRGNWMASSGCVSVGHAVPLGAQH